ncbi:ABC transporter ATP-binding protein [Actinacidiphila acididurans]|uniref:ABC transporter ATP-binding protein n=1 Tax=Actinacidiphila acididurans TaxID=2784346 RepID=A0ABS2U6C0_9ACTN|nr:ABC transporter ATP-binding protein [Actinacidiphila acididurans]MBM9510736.1 ABC transporter ATP-binding protein [Actinacidiphila acididurans]
MVMVGGPAPVHLAGPGPGGPPQRVRPGTFRRVLPYLRPYRGSLVVLSLSTAVSAAITALSPLLLMVIIDRGVLPRHLSVVVWAALGVFGLAAADAAMSLVTARSSGRVGQGLVCDLRIEVFDHVRRQPLAFFTHAQTGSLVSRLNTDVIGAQQAVTLLLSETVSLSLTLIFTLVTMFLLSWQITLLALLVVPLTMLPGRLFGRRMQTLVRQGMQRDADLGAMLNERFNVAGAMLSKLYGRPREESVAFAARAGGVRDIYTTIQVYGRALACVGALVIGAATALVYGVGGYLVIDGGLELGGLVAMGTLLLRLFAPANGLSNIQVHFMTALVSFDRIFELLDLRPLVVERPDARDFPAPLPAARGGLDIEFDDVVFGYPSARESSVASLEVMAPPGGSGRDERGGPILNGITFVAPAGRMTALVGPSGAGKTTITTLVPRLYDPLGGAVRIAGVDLRELRLQAVQDVVGVVSQDAHLFHDTIRANLLYARPGASEREIVEACTAARIWETVEALPQGLDTVVGDRGHRLSGGEKQRIALARLLLKAPPVVVLDEATAHLDSASEAAVQQALRTALTGRTSLVIAHRLSTIREADQILYVDKGEIHERGTHDELLAANGRYAELYRKQFATQLG